MALLMAADSMLDVVCAAGLLLMFEAEPAPFDMSAFMQNFNLAALPSVKQVLHRDEYLAGQILGLNLWSGISGFSGSGNFWKFHRAIFGKFPVRPKIQILCFVI